MAYQKNNLIPSMYFYWVKQSKMYTTCINVQYIHKCMHKCIYSTLTSCAFTNTEWKCAGDFYKDMGGCLKWLLTLSSSDPPTRGPLVFCTGRISRSLAVYCLPHVVLQSLASGQCAKLCNRLVSTNQRLRIGHVTTNQRPSLVSSYTHAHDWAMWARAF